MFLLEGVLCLFSFAILFAGHKDSVSNVAFSHDGSYLATGDLSGFLQVWQLTVGRVIWSGEADSDLEVQCCFWEW